MREPALLIAGHGSRDEDGTCEFHELCEIVQRRAPDVPVAGGFIELSLPPLSQAVTRLVEAGERDLVCVPLMLVAAGHAKNDIPASLARERLVHSGLRIRYARPLGIRPELVEIVDERVRATIDPGSDAETTVVLVGRGSTDPDANSDVAKIARLLYEGRAYPAVEHAFVSLAAPSVPEALERCRRLGAGRIVVVPYFLFTGVLERRIRAQAIEFADAHLGLDVRVAGYLRAEERIAELVLMRYREAIDGDLRMNCDVCVHRVALPGFEHKVGTPATPHYHPADNRHHHDHHHTHRH
ncbi:MAG: sirohydrochlorin chelatase [Gaiellaceae bacterium]